jgi:glycosyltransferase involved in cell wall biosynthesis
VDDARDGAELISIVIPALNAAATLGAQLEALIGEHGIEQCEVIVADNGSTDDTVAVAMRYRGRLDLTLVDAREHPGRSAVRNEAVRHVTRPYIAFLDADDAVCAGWLPTIVRHLPAPVVQGGYRRVPRHASADDRNVTVRFPSYRGVQTIAAGNVVIEKRVLDLVGGFNEQYRYRVDVELAIRLHLAGIPIVIAEDACILYRERGSARGAMRQQYNWEKAAVQLQRDYGDRIEFRHSSRNSLKHWALLVPHAIDALRDDEDRRRWLADLGALSGRLVGSLTYRTLFL